MDKDFKKQRDSLAQMSRDAAELREDVLEFQGLEREFFSLQDLLLQQYKKSDGLKHPVNRGDAREDHLRDFFINEGFIPKKYGVTNVSSRVVSSSGHHSEEIDILFYDKFNTATLIKFPSVEFYPVESVYGVIQVKSCFRNTKTIKDGLKNISSFKTLAKSGESITNINNLIVKSSVTKGFGILFAYTSTLKWLTTIKAITEYMDENPSYSWPNAVVILDQGIIIPRGENRGFYKTEDIDKLSKTDVFGIPNYDDCLLRMYGMLMDLLNNTRLSEVNINQYMRLPLITGDLSYSYTFGQAAETGNCEKHGKYLREINKKNLQKIIEFCNKAESINWIKANDIAYGGKGDDEERYKKQPGNVKIYNPENKKLEEILVFQEGLRSLAYDSINVGDNVYWIPYYYSLKDSLVTMHCPKCKKPNN